MVLIRMILLISFAFSDTFENVKVLDIESRSEMKKYMRSIAKDLGVKCSYCHDMDDKSLDTPEKEIAREMIILTRQINSYLSDLYFKNSLYNTKDTNHGTIRTATSVSCWTCHKGHPEVEEERPKD